MADRYLMGFTKLAPTEPDQQALKDEMMQQAEEMGLADYLKLHGSYDAQIIKGDVDDFILEMVSPFCLDARFLRDNRDMFDEFRKSDEDFPNEEMLGRINEAVLLYHVQALIQRDVLEIVSDYKNDLSKGKAPIRLKRLAEVEMIGVCSSHDEALNVRLEFVCLCRKLLIKI